MEEKKIYWFRGNEGYGQELMDRLVSEFGGKNPCHFTGTDGESFYVKDEDGLIRIYDRFWYEENHEDVDRFVELKPSVATNIPAEKLKPTSTVVTAPFYRVQYGECVKPEYYQTYKDAKDVAERISEKHNVKTYILAPIAKIVPTVTVAMAAFNDSDRPKGC